MKAHVSILDKERIFDFTESDFKVVQKLIYDHAGIRLSDTKHDMVYSRIIRRLRATKLSSFNQYLSLIQRDRCRARSKAHASSHRGPSGSCSPPTE